MASDSGADDAAALRERVAQLEETVSEQQATSESPPSPTASRRGLLSAAAGVAGLGALGIYSSYPASAQAAGQVGTQSEPVDVEAYDLNVQGSLTGVNTGGVQNPLTGDLDGGGNSLINVAAVETDKVHNEWFADPSDDLGSLISDINADYGTGVIKLLPGTHTADNVTVPPGITVKTSNASEESGSRVQIEPSADNTSFVVETGDTARSSGKLVGLNIDANATSAYSSTLVDIVLGNSESPRYPIVDECALHLPISAGATGIRVDGDTNDTGTGYLEVSDTSIIGADTCLHLKATTANSYINAFQGREMYMRGGGSEMIKEEGSIGNPYYDIEAQIGTSTGAFIRATSEFVMDVLMYDAGGSSEYPGGKFWDLSNASIQASDPVQINSRRDVAGRAGLVTTNPLLTRQTPSQKLRWDITETRLPYWLTEAGTGTLNFASGLSRATIETGSSSGNAKIVQSKLLPTGSSAHPLFGWTEVVADTTQTVTKTGVVNPNGSFEARFYADPTDSLGTGITSNYIFRVVDTDGTEVLAEDTGLSFGSRERFGIGLLSGDVVYGAVPSDDKVTTLQSLSSTVSDHNFRFEVETQENASKRLQIDFGAQVEWTD